MSTRDEVAARNRALMPQLFEAADWFRDNFGSVKVLYVREGGLLLGAPPVYTGTWVSSADMHSLDMVEEK